MPPVGGKLIRESHRDKATLISTTNCASSKLAYFRRTYYFLDTLLILILNFRHSGNSSPLLLEPTALLYHHADPTSLKCYHRITSSLDPGLFPERSRHLGIIHHTRSWMSSVAACLYPESSPLYGGLRHNVSNDPISLKPTSLTYLAMFFAPTMPAAPTAYNASKFLQLPL